MKTILLLVFSASLILVSPLRAMTSTNNAPSEAVSKNKKHSCDDPRFAELRQERKAFFDKMRPKMEEMKKEMESLKNELKQIKDDQSLSKDQKKARLADLKARKEQLRQKRDDMKTEIKAFREKMKVRRDELGIGKQSGESQTKTPEKI
ncbi:MAG: hypothetical protein PHV34_18315 [Verrucomicrobiae bacterium]|nr:hypothetical protein [Verrucomicrobiae bacterium]